MGARLGEAGSPSRAKDDLAVRGDLTYAEIERHLATVYETVAYDDLPSRDEAIRLLNEAAAYVVGLREMIHPYVKKESEGGR